MSKSLGNLVTIEEFLDKYPADVLRMMVLNSAYRSPLTFNDEVIGQAKRALERLRGALRPAAPADATKDGYQAVESLPAQMEKTRVGFLQAMDDDFNTAGALGQLFDLVSSINQARDGGASREKLAAAHDLLRELAGVFGLRLDLLQEESTQAALFVDLLLELRNELRSQKQWALADLVRNRLSALGVLIEDAKEGTTWRWQQ